MFDHGTLSLNNFIHFSWVLLIVAAVGTGISIASAVNNTCSIKHQDILVFSYLVTQIYHTVSQQLSVSKVLGLINHDA
jgi:hypothetical protein